MNTKMVAILGLTVLLSGVPTWASLDTVDISYDGMGASSTVKVYGGGQYGTKTPAGLLKCDVDSTSGLGDYFADYSTIGTFCVELSQYASYYSKTYALEDTVSYFGEDKAALLSELWGTYYDSSWLTSSSYTNEQKNAATAFQLCTWEIVYEDYGCRLDVTSDGTCGSLGFYTAHTSSSITDLANSMLASLTGSGTMANLTVLTNACAQDYITEVPEPATIGMLGLGMLMVTRARRK